MLLRGQASINAVHTLQARYVPAIGACLYPSWGGAFAPPRHGSCSPVACLVPMHGAERAQPTVNASCHLCDRYVTSKAGS
jgi:hypothetical protein